jgi:hypothetical protein
MIALRPPASKPPVHAKHGGAALGKANRRLAALQVEA